MDRVLEENINRHALLEQREMALKWRNIGIGIMGMSEMLVKLGFKYGDPDSIGTMRNLMKFIFRESVIISAANGRIYGSFPEYDPKVWDSTIIRNAFSDEEITELRKQNTLRNCSLLSIAPTGSIATLLGLGGTGCEPFFALSFNRKTDNLNGTYKVELDIVKEYRKVWANDEDLPSFFVTSKDIPWKERIDMQAALQEFCDSGISSTVNLPKEITIEDVKDLYIYAWKKGCKGITIYKEGSRDPILFTESNNEKAPSNNELKRGEDTRVTCLDCIDTISRNDLGDVLHGETYKYQTACGALYITVNKDENGNIVEIFTNSSKNGTCKANLNGETRLASLALRAGVRTEEVIDTLKSIQCQSCAFAKAKGNKVDGTSCPDIISKCLKRSYENSNNKEIVTKKSDLKETIEDKSSDICPECGKKLIHSGGCVQCSCGYSKCN